MPWKPFSQCSEALWKREIQENTEKSRTQNEMAAGAWRPTENRAEQKPSAFESPARLAGGAPRTSALGLGDTPSSHTNLADPELGGLGGGASSPAARRPDGQGLGTRRLLERSRATGWRGAEIGVVPGTVALEGRPRAVAGVQEFQGLGKGEGNL